jgi:hypothetical protein
MVPVFDSRVRTQLNTAEWHRCTGKTVAMTSSSNGDLYQLRVVESTRSFPWLRKERIDLRGQPKRIINNVGERCRSGCAKKSSS